MSTGKAWKWRLVRLGAAQLCVVGSLAVWAAATAGATVVYSSLVCKFSEATIAAALPGTLEPVTVGWSGSAGPLIASFVPPAVSVATYATLQYAWLATVRADGLGQEVDVIAGTGDVWLYVYTVTKPAGVSTAECVTALGKTLLVASATPTGGTTVPTVLTTEKGAAQADAGGQMGIVIGGLVAIFALMIGIGVLVDLVRRVTR